MPTADGSSGQVLQTNGSGTLSFTTISSGASSLDDLTDVKQTNNSLFAGTIPPNWTSGAVSNTSFGIESLDAITNGDSNTAMGYRSLTAITDGLRNTAMGQSALKSSVSGDNTTSIGEQSLINATHDDNTALGFYTGSTLTTGQKNIIIGSKADVSASNSDNEIIIGYEATGSGNNTVTLGNANVTKVYMASDGAAEIYANGTINTSDKRLKEDIEETKLGLDFINKLKPVSYKYIKKTEDQEQKTHEGLIAQEVESVVNEYGLTKDNHSLVHYDESDDKYRLAYTELIGPLIKSVQELTKKNSELQARIEELEKK